MALNEIFMGARALDVRLHFSAEMDLPQGCSWGMQDLACAKRGIVQNWGAARSIWSAHFRAEHQTVRREEDGSVSIPGLRKRDPIVP